MNTVKSFQRVTDGRILNRFADTSPFYNDITRLELHFWHLLSNRDWIIKSIETPRGIFVLGEIPEGQRNNTIVLFYFNEIGTLITKLSNDVVMHADNLRKLPATTTPVATTIAGNTLRELETAYIRGIVRPIRIADSTEFTTGNRIARTRRESIEDFLTKFFKNWNENRNTIYTDDNSVQTEMGKRRSLGDIFAICRYYYPTCTLKEVAKALYVTLNETITDGYRSSYCNTINKRVFYYDNTKENGVFDKTTNDETGHPHRWWIEQLN